VSFYRKRDRMQIIADILNSCRRPQTQTYIRRQTTISYTVLQTCTTHLLSKRWLAQIEEENGQKKLKVTNKGLVFLNKWVELQKMVNKKKPRKLEGSAPETRTITVKTE
jgi:predicted transcriptional regulator